MSNETELNEHLKAALGTQDSNDNKANAEMMLILIKMLQRQNLLLNTLNRLLTSISPNSQASDNKPVIH